MIGWYSWKGWLMMLPLDRFTVFICNLWEDSCGIVEIATHPNGSIHRSLFILLMAEIPRPTTWDRLGSAKPCKCWDKPPVEVGSLSHYFDKVLHIPGVCLGFLCINSIKLYPHTISPPETARYKALWRNILAVRISLFDFPSWPQPVVLGKNLQGASA